jgi:hypothetical protein
MPSGLTPAEARHLINVITDYMLRNPDSFLESTIDVINHTEVTTDQIMTKLANFATNMEQEE